MEVLKIVKIEYVDGKTLIDYKTFKDDIENTAGQWSQEGELTNEQVVEYAKTMVDAGIEVSLEI